jgi:hypothetical protein
MSRELADQVRTALGKNQPPGDVWEAATTEPPPGEAPECAWCPLCRAARLVREAKPGRDTRVQAVGDALTTVVQDAVSVLEAALAATGRDASRGGRRDEAGPGTRGFPAAGQAPASAAAPPAASAAAPPANPANPANPASPAAPAPAAADGQAAPAEGGQAAAVPVEEPPREPDDRG